MTEIVQPGGIVAAPLLAPTPMDGTGVRRRDRRVGDRRTESRAVRPGTGPPVMVVTKARVERGSTQWAQGGIAAAIDEDDSPDDHLRDTLIAGAGLCDEDAVRSW